MQNVRMYTLRNSFNKISESQRERGRERRHGSIKHQTEFVSQMKEQKVMETIPVCKHILPRGASSVELWEPRGNIVEKEMKQLFIKVRRDRGVKLKADEKMYGQPSLQPRMGGMAVPTSQTIIKVSNEYTGQSSFRALMSPTVIIL